MYRLGNDLTKWCEVHSKIWLKKVGLSHWSQTAKMIVFSLFVLGTPTIVATYMLLYIFVWTQNKVLDYMNKDE